MKKKIKRIKPKDFLVVWQNDFTKEQAHQLAYNAEKYVVVLPPKGRLETMSIDFLKSILKELENAR